MSIEVGVVCSANVCRSPMAAALMRESAARHGADIIVMSVGMIGGGRRADPAVVRAMDRRGIDLDGHRSFGIDEVDLDALDLILTMERDHLRGIVVGRPHLWPRTFTIKEYVRRSAAAGDRPADEVWTAWLERLGDGRSRAELLGDGQRDDVAYPAPPTLRAVEATARLLDELVDAVVTRSFRLDVIDRPSATPFNT